MNDEPLHVYTDEENGLEARVWRSQNHNGWFTVTLTDLDSGETLPTRPTYPSLIMATYNARRMASF